MEEENKFRACPFRSLEKIRLGELEKERGRGKHRDGDCQPPFPESTPAGPYMSVKLDA